MRHIGHYSDQEMLLYDRLGPKARAAIGAAHRLVHINKVLAAFQRQRGSVEINGDFYPAPAYNSSDGDAEFAKWIEDNVIRGDAKMSLDELILKPLRTGPVTACHAREVHTMTTDLIANQVAAMREFIDNSELAQKVDRSVIYNAIMDGVMPTLVERCMDQLIPEPIVVMRDEDGVFHFATAARPLRIVVDVHNLSVGFGWMNINSVKKTITFSLDGEVLVYHRVGKDPHGWWVCDRVQHDAQLHEGDRTPDGPQA